jgi:hypothetical protein
MDISDDDVAAGETDTFNTDMISEQTTDAVAVAEETEPTEVKELDVHGRARKRRWQMARESGDLEAEAIVNDKTIPTLDTQTPSDGMPVPQTNRPSSPPSSDGSFSSASEHRRKHKRKHRHEKHKRRDSHSDSSEESRRRRKHKHRRKEKKRKKDKSK